MESLLESGNLDARAAHTARTEIFLDQSTAVVLIAKVSESGAARIDVMVKLSFTTDSDPRVAVEHVAQ
jgi:hypothetical protein